MSLRSMKIVLLGSFVVFTPSWAHAQESPSKEPGGRVDGYAYVFEDDALLVDSMSATGAVLRVRKGAVRVLLMRPRLQFVGELLKSAEGL